jgi:hypothetical protein
MTTPTYVSPFTGTVVEPTDVSYYSLTFSETTPLVWPQVANGTDVPASRIMDCVATADGLQIILPPGNQGAVGTDILFRNLGAHTFTINDSSLDSSVIVAPGKSLYYYLIDNGTTDGTWNNVTFGAGTSYADAATLQGAGLTTLLGKLATAQNVVDVTATPTINDASRASTFVWNGGVGTFNLPAPSTLSAGWYILFRNAGTGSLNIVPPSPIVINGQPSITVNPGDSGFIILDNSTQTFITVGLTSPSNAVFSAATYDVDSIVGNTFSLVANAPVIQTYIAQSGTRTQTLAVTLPAITQIYILVNDTNQSGYNVTFQCTGSSQPPLVLTTGTIATVLSDGTNLYPLTQVSAGVFLAVNGTAGSPSFAFNSDTHTGMYLVGTNILGLSANGTEMVQIDNSNTLQPLVTVNARLKAQLIDGGTF